MKYAGMYYNFEIFHMLKKQIPVDSVEVQSIYNLEQYGLSLGKY